MIVSASYRTDIPAHYGAWFLRRLDAGFAMVASPYGGPDYRVSLAPGDADGFVFWTRNAGPFLPVLEEVKRRGFPFVVQFTITGTPRVLEPGTLETAAAIAAYRKAYRYAPDDARRAETARKLARLGAGVSDRAEP